MPQPAYEYIVESVHVQNGMSSQSTAVVLKSAEGKTIKAFARGLHAALTPGAALSSVNSPSRSRAPWSTISWRVTNWPMGRRAA